MDDMSGRARWLSVLALLALAGGGVWAVQPRSGPPAVASWRLDGPLDTSATEIPILVHERACASGRPADGRIEKPAAAFSATRVAVVVKVRPLGGDVDCQTNPETPFVLTLAEPVGDRRLVDAGGLPPMRRE